MSPDPVLPGRVLIVCIPCRIVVVLGDRQEATTGGTEVITVAGRPAWQHQETNAALWRFITDHGDHRAATVVEGDTHFGDGTPVPGDLRLVELSAAARYKAPDDLTVSDYVRGWPERPQHPVVVGPRRYTALYPQPEPPPIAGVVDKRATLRPGIPAAPTVRRPLYVPGWIRPTWLDYFLHYSYSLDCWVLAAVTTVGDIARLVDLDHHGHLDEWAANTAQDWARQLLEAGIDEDDLRPAGVTEWRPVVYDDTPGWAPLFDTTDPRRLLWTDLAAATGSRHQPRHTGPAGLARIVDPATAGSR
ncbi:hypothetical protein DMB66_32770 [Actinoplanes sp. ATCC 53533]|uniref:hypothetical protein n=1 Tax=Actinoplanes sp. ATCC 53533 TaxID=1288362 RepID=UPI000F7A8B47|nr:hypothetical protein [Actinoplanes sp. ATCC 53533]RSM56796.1 hypothetical protein DMB66_32770 [Actinoplanes sp. ATCC 53533]